jgi:hypothetical protein
MDGARRGSINDARAAQLAIDAFEFDEGFIDDKLRRFNQRFQGERDPEVRAKVAPMVSLVLSSLQDRRFAEANAHLNDALSTLEGR